MAGGDRKHGLAEKEHRDEAVHKAANRGQVTADRYGLVFESFTINLY
jgi:hypothetical protein